MPRDRSPNRQLAKDMYLKSKGQKKLKEIAEELGVLDTQVRKWKCTDKWDDELTGTLPKNKRNVPNKKSLTQKQFKSEEEIIEIENPELTEKQSLFCIYYIKYFNATKAAIKAGYSKETAGKQGYQLLGKTRIKEEIQRLKQNKLNRAMLSEDDIFQKYIDIAFSDITDYMEFGQKEMPMLNPLTGEQMVDEEDNPMTYTVNYADFKDSSEIDGTIISEVSKGKDGAKLKLQDKMKALDWLANHIGLLDIATQEKLKLEREKLDFERTKAKVPGVDDEENETGVVILPEINYSLQEDEE